MTIYVKRCKLQVASSLADFVEAKVLPGIGILPADFWLGFSKMIEDFGPTNKALLAERKKLQLEIDAWHVANRAVGFDAASYQSFLYEIGYLLPEGSNFLIETDNVDPEIAKIPGPQLVVPVMNARFALNAANARWGSLYDALYVLMLLVNCRKKKDTMLSEVSALFRGLKTFSMSPCLYPELIGLT